jgi:hypothetical protein
MTADDQVAGSGVGAGEAGISSAPRPCRLALLLALSLITLLWQRWLIQLVGA